MKLSAGEKLILLALADAKDGENLIDLAFVRKAIVGGDSWALDWQLSYVSTEETPEHIADETADILAMWRVVEHGVSTLNAGDKDAIGKRVYPYALEFEGFDGNNDRHFGVAQFLVHQMDRFEELKNRALNSHSQASLPHYRRMLDRYKLIQSKKSFDFTPLTVDELAEIIGEAQPS